MVEFDRVGFRPRIVSSDLFDVTPVPREALVANDDAIKRFFLCPVAAHPNSDAHAKSSFSFLVKRVGHPAEKRAHTQLAHPLHHFFHFQKLFHQAIYVRDSRAAPLGDTAAPAAVQYCRIAPFFQRHRVDDRVYSF